MATVDVEVHATVDRPREEVAAYCCDPDNFPTWRADIVAVQWNTAGPLTVGSRIVHDSDFLGRPLRYAYEVVELVPGERLAMRSDREPYVMETTFAWVDTDEGGTWMTMRSRGTPTAFAGLTTPILATAFRRATMKDLDRLKLILEGHGP